MLRKGPRLLFSILYYPVGTYNNFMTTLDKQSHEAEKTFYEVSFLISIL